MSERRPNDHSGEQLQPFESKEAYTDYVYRIFKDLEAERSPMMVDAEANELLLLVLRHQEFTPTERLRELNFVSHLAMIRLRGFVQPGADPSVVRRAEVIHSAYAQVYSQSMLELAKQEDVTSAFQRNL